MSGPDTGGTVDLRPTWQAWALRFAWACAAVCVAVALVVAVHTTVEVAREPDSLAGLGYMFAVVISCGAGVVTLLALAARRTTGRLSTVLCVVAAVAGALITRSVLGTVLPGL